MYGLFCLLICLFIYFFPTYMAFIREHKNKVPILILNMFLGWTVLGWIVALIWAFTNQERVRA